MVALKALDTDAYLGHQPMSGAQLRYSVRAAG